MHHLAVTLDVMAFASKGQMSPWRARCIPVPERRADVVLASESVIVDRV